MPGGDDDEMVQALVDLSNEKEDEKSLKKKYGEKKSTSISWLKDLNEGYLHMSKEIKAKKPTKYEKWWFVLEDATLSYFAKKDLKKLIGSIDIATIKVIKPMDELSKKKKNVLLISANENDYYVYAESSKTRARWIGVIQEKVDEKKKSMQAAAAKSAASASASAPSVAFAPTLVTFASSTPNPAPPVTAPSASTPTLSATSNTTTPTPAPAPVVAAPVQTVPKAAEPVPPVEEPKVIKPVLFKAVGLFDCEAEEPTDLGFCVGDLLDILDDSDPGWWEASLNGHSGIIPSNYVHQLKEGENPADVLAQLREVEDMDEEQILENLSLDDGAPEEELRQDVPEEVETTPVEEATVEETPREVQPEESVEIETTQPLTSVETTENKIESDQESSAEETPVKNEIKPSSEEQESQISSPVESSQSTEDVTTPSPEPSIVPEITKEVCVAMPAVATPREFEPQEILSESLLESQPESQPELQLESQPKPQTESQPESQPKPQLESPQPETPQPTPQPELQQPATQSESQTKSEELLATQSPRVPLEPEPTPQLESPGTAPSTPKKQQTSPSATAPIEESKPSTTPTVPERNTLILSDQGVATPTNRRGVNCVIALNHHESNDPTALSFRKGDIITILSRTQDGKLLRGELKGKQGFFPADLAQSTSSLVSKPPPTFNVGGASAKAKEDMSGVAQRTASLRDKWKAVESRGALAPAPSVAPKPKPAPVASVSGARTLFRGLEATAGKAPNPKRQFYAPKAGPKAGPSKPERASRMFTESEIKLSTMQYTDAAQNSS